MGNSGHCDAGCIPRKRVDLPGRGTAGGTRRSSVRGTLVMGLNPDSRLGSLIKPSVWAEPAPAAIPKRGNSDPVPANGQGV